MRNYGTVVKFKSLPTRLSEKLSIRREKSSPPESQNLGGPAAESAGPKAREREKTLFPAVPMPVPPERNSNGQGSQTAKSLDQSAFGRLTIVLPLFHNPDEHGDRHPISGRVLAETEAELRTMCDGYTWWLVFGWYRCPMTGTGFSDASILCTITGIFTPAVRAKFAEWQRLLETTKRFDQKSLYFDYSEPIGKESGAEEMGVAA